MVAERKREPGRVARSERLELRLTPAERALIQRAADLEDRPVAEFARERLRAAAETTVEEHRTIKLTADESAAFVEALLNPPPPSQGLQDAHDAYRRLIVR